MLLKVQMTLYYVIEQIPTQIYRIREGVFSFFLKLDISIIDHTLRLFEVLIGFSPILIAYWRHKNEQNTSLNRRIHQKSHTKDLFAVQAP